MIIAYAKYLLCALLKSQEQAFEFAVEGSNLTNLRFSQMMYAALCLSNTTPTQKLLFTRLSLG